MMHRFLSVSLFCSLLLWAAPATEENATPAMLHPLHEVNQTAAQPAAGQKKLKTNRINMLLMEKKVLEKKLLDNNIWSKIYSNYHVYQELKKNEEKLNDKINVLNRTHIRTAKEERELEQKINEREILQGKLQLLREYEKNPFKKFLTPPEIGETPTVGNPFAVISALSYIKKLQSDQEEYANRYRSLQTIMEKFMKRKRILEELTSLDKKNEHFKQELKDSTEKINTFIPILEIFKTTQEVYDKKIDEIKLNLRADIKKEMEKATVTGGIILFFVLLIFIIKYLVRRYMSDNERFYTINKALNITFATLLIFILLFAYIENVSYLVTILGFASAGIAIAMKDWFMSIMGWFVIIIGGSIHVGDRVKFVRGNVEYVGDVVDISLLRMTIQEDVTLTSYMHNRRAGRIIFVPNNFVFTDMIANYSHAGLKTVWDGIDFMITFDSNVSKATSITKEIVKKYSKGYTDITRKQLNKLRSQYSMKNTNVEPRVYSFIEPYGIKVSAWYHTNAYATLTLRSTISSEIIERLQAEKDIFLAFPTQSVYLDKDVRKPLPPEEIQDDEETLV
ncbi:mechanosensitive ion channel domain-containing protein [Sulfurovum sp.]|uniref:mechanosensitive ion channel domain-containing protein n=1 Tax=Sulfurovum sp. TaxID=1969726 RepID=UPI0025FA5963|nr:mechanosensitive ion channel domain-containing protein [Sulfurovum sp.]